MGHWVIANARKKGKQTFIMWIKGAYLESLFAGGGEQFIISPRLGNRQRGEETTKIINVRLQRYKKEFSLSTEVTKNNNNQAFFQTIRYWKLPFVI